MAEWMNPLLSLKGRQPKKCDITVYVTTGDKLGAGTDANVWLVIEDVNGKRSERLKLDRPFHDDFERGHTDVFPQPQLQGFGDIAVIEFGRDNFGFGSQWFVDKFRIDNRGTIFIFPVQRWIKAHRRYKMRLHDCCVPAASADLEGRKNELQDKRNTYSYRQVIPGGPVQIAVLPEDEKFSEGYLIDFLGEKIALLAKAKTIKMTMGRISCLTQIKSLYTLDNKFPEPKLVEPICLLYRDQHSDLLPVAIQLHQDKRPGNPVFLPTDPPHTWMLAKMWYNMADAQYHQSISHLGLTHLLMEGVCVCTHRTLSPSHPVFRILAPHFLYLLAINTRGLEKLVAPGQWVDSCLTIQRHGMFQLIVKAFDMYHMTRQGNVRNEIKSRGLLDKDVLPYYPYRDDAVALYDVIHDYVQDIIVHYYPSKGMVEDDEELSEWRKELSCTRDRLQGVGLKGVPGSDLYGFLTRDQVIETLTIIIYTCSVGHAATNFQQYEAYGYVPNYPGMLLGEPPKDKSPRTEEAIISVLPDKGKILDIMVITKLLSMQGTKKLGDFEVDYMYDEVSLQARKRFKERLQELGDAIKIRNLHMHHPYIYLDPTECVPNAISI